MISIVTIFKSFCEYNKKYVCGPDPMPEFNRKINEVQKELMDLIAPQYDINERIKNLMRPFIKQHSATGIMSGLNPYPADLYRMVGAVTVNQSATQFTAHNTYENGANLNDLIPQRRPSVSGKIAYYQYSVDGIQLYPNTISECSYYYIKSPVNGVLNYVFEADPDTDEMLLVEDIDTVDLEWDESAFNLILYKLLEKYGAIEKDVLDIEFSKAGLKSDIATA